MVERFKNTEVGIIPVDWNAKNIVENSTMKARIGWQGLTVAEYLNNGDFYLITGTDFVDGKIKWDTCCFVDKERYIQDKNIQIKVDDILITKDGTIGKIAFVDRIPLPATLNSGVFVIRPKDSAYIPQFLFYIFNSSYFRYFLNKLVAGSTINHLYQKDFISFNFPLPPTKAEQTAIATALSDADALITSLEKLIAKKKAIKQGAMQELLRPKEGWEVKTIYDTTVCMDNLRVPLNENQRLSMKGDYPYCGANGILDYINDFKIDDEVLLIAEDGGYFDEYATRPIAYKMKGRFWVNNHAHILKTKNEYDQDFIFYSLVHKNILTFLASGTRAKLNKSEMYKIDIDIPKNKTEQTRIAKILSNMDSEIEALEKKLEKQKQIKQGMMQNLLTGKIRLV